MKIITLFWRSPFLLVQCHLQDSGDEHEDSHPWNVLIACHLSKTMIYQKGLHILTLEGSLQIKMSDNTVDVKIS